MERLTHKAPGVPAVPVNIDLDFVFDLADHTWNGLSAIFERLAEYEDTGMTPAEVVALKKAFERLNDEAERLYTEALT